MQPRTSAGTKRTFPALSWLLSTAIFLSGCVSPIAGNDGKYATPIGGAPVTENPTPYSEALVCLADFASRTSASPPRIAVGTLRDLTGQLDGNGGRPVTQGAMLMAISALNRAGIPLVERYETDVPKLEYDLANNKLISDVPFTSNSVRRDYRGIFPGQVSGSDFFLAGGITELNSSIRSFNASGSLKDGGRSNASFLPNANTYVMNIGLDIRLINTSSLDIVDVVSYQKQIIGYQVGVGMFAFFGNQILNVTASGSGEEPLHLAVRSLIERAVLEMVARRYKISPSVCLDPGSDPLRGVPRTDRVKSRVPTPELPVRNSPPEDWMPATAQLRGLEQPCCELRSGLPQ